MKNLLFISNIAERIDSFSKDAIFAAHKCMLTYHSAANWKNASSEQIEHDQKEYDITIHSIDVSRSPYAVSNRKAYSQLKEIVEKNHIQYIHCNTPIGGVLGRLLRKRVKKVIYEAHGFHFYKGAPLMNWLLYYPVEKMLAYWTDAIITINQDDYQFARKHLKPKSKIYYVPGVGIELEQWKLGKDIRPETGISEDDFVVLVVGRLEKNKNCRRIIDAVCQIQNTRVKLVFCGDGEDRQMLAEKAAPFGNRVVFLGNRTDMPDVYHMADCFVLASFREGLSRSIMEAMACGLPCVVSDIRGNRDLIDDAEGGYLFDPRDVQGLKKAVIKVLDSEETRRKMKAHNLEKIKGFRFDRVVDEMAAIYRKQFLT